MEELTNPVQMSVPIFTLFVWIVGWCIWLTIQIFASKRDIAVNNSNDTNVAGKISDLDRKIDKMEDHFNAKFDQIFGELKELNRQRQ